MARRTLNIRAWPYDMRPKVRAEKYGCPQCVPKSTSVTLAVDEKTLPMATITGRTDGQTDRRTDRVRRNMRPPPREEGRIKITGSGRWRGPIPPPARVFFPISIFTKKRSDEMQRLNTCISKAEPKKIFWPRQRPPSWG